MKPVFIELDPGRYVNAALVLEVIPNTSNGCNVYTSESDYAKAPYSTEEFVARVNNALALMQMIERAAK